MLIEVRKLVFSDDLLQRALLKQCAAEGITLPNSKLEKVKVFGAGQSTDKIKVILQFMTADPKRPREITLNDQSVLAALIATCKRHNVPLPRSASKALQLTNQGLAMTVNLTLETPGT